LAQGYLNRPDLTAQRFVADPFATDATTFDTKACGAYTDNRMYRTGDIARYLPSGDIEYLGRVDGQLKIRGQRIELGEIEQQIMAYGGIAKAVVDVKPLAGKKPLTATGADDRHLVAYIQAVTNIEPNTEPNIKPNTKPNIKPNTKPNIKPITELDIDLLRSHLTKTLPLHMIPNHIVLVDDFKLTANGKLDRKALPLPNMPEIEALRDAAAGAEAIISGVFAELLQRESVDPDDSFFALGGHSLLAMQLAAKLRKALSLPVSVGQIMISPSVAELARVLVDESLRNDPAKAGFGQILPIRQSNNQSQDYTKVTPLICINPGSGFAWQYTGFPQYLDINCPVIGLQSPRPDGAVSISSNMEQAVEHYFDLLRQVQPKGPYRMVGYSFGGSVALGLATKLIAAGEKVEYIGLVDVYPPEQQQWKKPSQAELDQQVMAERQQLLAAANPNGDLAEEDIISNQDQEKMLNDIVNNYADTVRLLSNATTDVYRGPVDIFVAVNSLPEGWDVAKQWSPFIKNLTQHRLPFSHDDILAPQSLKTVAPLLNQRLKMLQNCKSS